MKNVKKKKRKTMKQAIKFDETVSIKYKPVVTNTACVTFTAFNISGNPTKYTVPVESITAISVKPQVAWVGTYVINGMHPYEKSTKEIIASYDVTIRDAGKIKSGSGDYLSVEEAAGVPVKEDGSVIFNVTKETYERLVAALNIEEHTC